MTFPGFSRFASAAAVVSFAALACTTDPTSPVPARLDALYVATSVGGAPLPASRSGEYDQRILLADTLRFYSDGILRRSISMRIITPRPPATDVVSAYQGEYSYTIEGRRVTITPICPPNALCIGPVSGSIDEARISLPYSVLGPEAGKLILERFLNPG